MKVINLSEHNSILNDFLKQIRSVDIQNDKMRFRHNIERIGQIMAYEISKKLTYKDETVNTPFEAMTIPQIQNKIVLAAILRAAIPFHHGFLRFFDEAENVFISAYRQYGRNKNGNQEIQIVTEYLAAPSVEGKTLIIVDPMLATGMSLEVAYKAILERGMPSDVHIASVIASQAGIRYLKKNLPKNITLWCGAVDPILNEKKYIVPGLGDAGDLCYGSKL
ncbi:MAG: uracil phosphoribosyltransferase [Paludibacteraceae bacterium]|nr:uracil phosphoribosyltransferase [Paludibacteraceae bacterium]